VVVEHGGPWRVLVFSRAGGVVYYFQQGH
jgi:hypothetical protein